MLRMPRTLFVHIGPRKTATSTIQQVMRNHDNSVVIYPKVGLWDDGSHHGLVFSFFDRRRKPQADTQSLFEDIARETRGSDLNVLISSETLNAEQDIEAFIGALLPYIDSETANVEILIACREHFSRVASLYNHRLRSGERVHPDEFLVKVAAKSCYRPLLDRLKKTGYKITGLNYHRADWVEHFLTHVGFTRAQLPNVKDKLVSLSPKATIAKIAINHVAESEDLNRALTEAFRKLPQARKPSMFIFGPEAAAEAERIFAPDRKLVWDEFGIELVPPAPEERKSVLFITPDELSEIAFVARPFGSKGEEIVRLASAYLRGPSADHQ